MTNAEWSMTNDWWPMTNEPSHPNEPDKRKPLSVQERGRTREDKWQAKMGWGDAPRNGILNLKFQILNHFNYFEVE